jgi:zinc transport system substrate-binding protein
MKLVFSLLLLLAFTTTAWAKPLTILVTIPPLQTFAQAIGGEHVTVNSLVPVGADPHIYEPRPSQMRSLTQTELLFTMSAMEIEQTWAPRLTDLRPSMQVITLTAGMPRLRTEAHHHHAAEHHEADDHAAEHHGADDHAAEHHGADDHAAHANNEMENDPHLWLSPRNVRAMSVVMRDAMIQARPAHAESFRQNHARFLRELDETEDSIRQQLRGLPAGAAFLVFHPAWTYFANEYGLRQIAIEFEGKEPKPARLQEIIAQARELGIRTVWADQQRSSRLAETIAEALGGEVIRTNPLDPDWHQNLRGIAEILHRANQKES